MQLFPALHVALIIYALVVRHEPLHTFCTLIGGSSEITTTNRRYIFHIEPQLQDLKEPFHSVVKSCDTCLPTQFRYTPLPKTASLEL